MDTLVAIRGIQNLNNLPDCHSYPFCHSRETGCCRIVITSKNVMLNLFQHLIKSMGYEIPKQVRDDKIPFLQQPGKREYRDKLQQESRCCLWKSRELPMNWIPVSAGNPGFRIKCGMTKKEPCSGYRECQVL